MAIQTRTSARMATIDIKNKKIIEHLDELREVSDRELNKEINRLKSVGYLTRETSNYRLSREFYCPHCNHYDYDCCDEEGIYEKEDNYITKGRYDDKLNDIEKMYNSKESVKQSLEICDANIAWIDDKICGKCNKPYSIINGA